MARNKKKNQDQEEKENSEVNETFAANNNYESNIYTSTGRLEELENDEISAAEEGFMLGYCS